MLIEFEETLKYTVKKCYKHPSHWIRFTVSGITDQIFKIQMLVEASPTPLYATWYFLSKELLLGPRNLGGALGQSLPWFEPDFSDYRKLIEKIKTYLVFS